MKKILFLAAILFAALCITGCENRSENNGNNIEDLPDCENNFENNEDDPKNGGCLTINAKVEDGQYLINHVDEVRVIGCIWESSYGCYDVTIASAPFENGGFTITLPEEIDERLLSKFPDHVFSILNVSNKDVRTTHFDMSSSNNIIACKDDNIMRFEYFELSTKNIIVRFLYVDADVIITGLSDSYYGKKKYDLNLKKGWNTVYEIWKENCSVNIIYTTKKINEELKWYFKFWGI